MHFSFNGHENIQTGLGGLGWVWAGGLIIHAAVRVGEDHEKLGLGMFRNT